MPEHTHKFTDWPFTDAVNTVSFSTEKVARLKFPVLRVSHDAEGDWQFLDATTEEPGECVLLCLGCVFEKDPTLAQVSDLPRGWSAYRSEIGAEWERWENPPEEDTCEHDEEAANQNALADIEKFGLHIINVGAEGDLPPFSYSIGIERSLGKPELIVIGLKAEVAQATINECYDQMKTGAPIAPGARVAGLLGGGFECLIGEVAPSYLKEYMGWAIWLHEGTGFRAWQIIFPNTAGVFPWEPEANDWFRNWQPLLAAEVKQ
jgi:hypothetical protein